MDRIVRISLAVVLIILAYANVIPQNLSIAVYVVSTIIAITGFVRICPLYKMLHMSTLREEPPQF
jgi:heme/copper-type cytochrome/quinol oxidase subunit 4